MNEKGEPPNIKMKTAHSKTTVQKQQTLNLQAQLYNPNLQAKRQSRKLQAQRLQYYRGARYQDAKFSRWLSPDPALSDYIPGTPVNDEAKKRNQNLPGMGGVFNTVNLHLYHYSFNNPINYTDPTGREGEYTAQQQEVQEYINMLAESDWGQTGRGQRLTGILQEMNDGGKIRLVDEPVGKVGGQYNGKNDTIWVARNFPHGKEGTAAALAHEATHAGQAREGRLGSMSYNPRMGIAEGYTFNIEREAYDNQEMVLNALLGYEFDFHISDEQIHEWYPDLDDRL